MSSHQPLIQRLLQWGSCDIADALSKLGYTTGGYLQGLKLHSPEYMAGATKIAGPVFTVKFATKAEGLSPNFQGHYIDHVPKHSILVISQPLPHSHSCYGGLMSLRAKALGAQGAVIDGSLRDLQEHRAAEFPVFARENGTTAANAVATAVDINIPIKLVSSAQDVVVRPGDFVLADVDGVVLIPGEVVEQVLESVPVIVSANDKCADVIRSGMSVQEAFATYRGKPKP